MKMLELKWGSKSLCVPMHRITRIQSSNKGVDVYLQGAGRPQWADVSFSKVFIMKDIIQDIEGQTTRLTGGFD